MARHLHPLQRREVPVDLRPERFQLACSRSSSPSTSICRSPPIRFSSSICRSSSRIGFSNSSVRLRPSGSSRLDVVDGIGAQESAQGPNEVFLRRDADATGPEPHRLSIPVAPLNIQGRGAGVGRRAPRPPGATRGAARPAPATGGSGRRRRTALSSSRARADSTMNVVVLAAVPVAVAALEQQRHVGEDRSVEHGPGLGEDEHFGRPGNPRPSAARTPRRSSW